MVEDPSLDLVQRDAFSPIARHYDRIMEHVDYLRWECIVSVLGAMLPAPVIHLDAGCGTGVLLHRMRHSGWFSLGLDLSSAMLCAAAKKQQGLPLVRGTICALPFSPSLGFITCLFDSINFLLREEQIHQAFGSFYEALKPGGLLYFDIVTARMITDYFNNETWTESHGRFRSTWKSLYDPDTGICETHVSVNDREPSITYERIYPTDFLLESLRGQGFVLLAARDMHTWKAPTHRTTRIDIIAAKGDDLPYRNKFKTVDNSLRKLLGK